MSPKWDGPMPLGLSSPLPDLRFVNQFVDWARFAGMFPRLFFLNKNPLSINVLRLQWTLCLAVLSGVIFGSNPGC